MKKIKIIECSPRHGAFLFKKSKFSVRQKVSYINKLSQTGLYKIDCSAFTHPRLFPQHADAEKIISGIKKNPAVIYIGIAPNEVGFRRAILTDVDEITLLVSASDEYNRFALGSTIKETVNKIFPAILEGAKKTNKSIRGSILTSFGCPFSGQVPSTKVAELASELTFMGVKEIALVDSTGLANPKKVESLIKDIMKQKLDVSLAVHFYNTRGSAIANALAAYEAGINIFSTAIGGLSSDLFKQLDLGIGYGNIPTEDLVNLFEKMDISTGVDIHKLIPCIEMAEKMIGTPLPGHILRAGPG